MTIGIYKSHHHPTHAAKLNLPTENAFLSRNLPSAKISSDTKSVREIHARGFQGILSESISKDDCPFHLSCCNALQNIRLLFYLSNTANVSLKQTVFCWSSIYCGLCIFYIYYMKDMCI